MRSDERKYADLGKFEVVFTRLEEELGKCIERTSNNKGSAYDYIRRVLMRMDEEVPRGENYRNFLSEVERTVRISRADSEERDRTFFSGIMEKLKEELQTAVPNGDYESVDAKKIMEIAQQLLAIIEKELKEKEKAEVSYDVKAPNGYFKKLQDEFEQKARRMLMPEEREAVASYIRRMRGEAEELETAENQGVQTTLTNLTKLLDGFIAQQIQVEKYGNLGVPNKISYEKEKETMKALNNMPDPFESNFVVSNEMNQETMEALNNAPRPFEDGVSIDTLAEQAFANAPVVDLDDESMETIAATATAHSVEEETMEQIVPEVQDKEADNGDLTYEVLRQPQYDVDGKLIIRGSAKTRSVGNMKNLAQGQRYVTIHNKDFDLTCTVEEAIRMLEHGRAVANARAKNKIDSLFEK